MEHRAIILHGVDGCKSSNVGYDGRLFHDLRRSVVRNMVRRAVPGKWAMMISGHKTPSVLQRYNIVSDDDLENARDRMQEGEAERWGIRAHLPPPGHHRGRGKSPGTTRAQSCCQSQLGTNWAQVHRLRCIVFNMVIQVSHCLICSYAGFGPVAQR